MSWQDLPGLHAFSKIRSYTGPKPQAGGAQVLVLPHIYQKRGTLEIGGLWPLLSLPHPYTPPCLWPGPGVCGGGQFQFPLGAGWSWPLLGWGSHCGRKVCLRLWLGPLSSSVGAKWGISRKGWEAEIWMQDGRSCGHLPGRNWLRPLNHVPVTQHLLREGHSEQSRQNSPP